MDQPQNINEELLEFFKALGDANRLKIVGLLAQKSYTVEELAVTLGLSASTTSHHLSRLSKSGLVTAKADGHYYVYSLMTDILREMSQRLLAEETPQRPEEEDANLDLFERKVMTSFVDSDGRITAFPAQEKKFLVLLRYVLKAFEPGVRYPEKKVNFMLSRYNDDVAVLRRSLVDNYMMEREGGGGDYWRPVE